MILLVAPRTDEPTARIAAHLERAGQRAAWFDTTSFPQESVLIFRMVRGDCRASLRIGELTLHLDTVASIWSPCAFSPSAQAVADPQARAFAELECRRALEDLLSVAQARWVPGPLETIRRGQHKLRQLRMAAFVGFATPDTLVTNSPDDALSFHRHQAGNIVSKLTSADAFHTTLGDRFARYTEQVSPHDMADENAFRYCPVTLQEHLDKELELRVTVVGEQVFVAAIDSQRSCHSRLDWRRYDRNRATLRPYDLPPGVARCCREITRRLGLAYGAIDLVLTTDGRYVFLELNPAGQYEWVERATDLPISKAICDLLSQRSPGELP